MRFKVFGIALNAAFRFARPRRKLLASFYKAL